MKGVHRVLGKKVVIVIMMIPIALLHFVTGSNYGGPYAASVNGYLLEILLAFALCFLLCLNEFYPLRVWTVRSLLASGVGCSGEIARSFGVPIFARTYDPVDFIIYGTGVVIAAILDTRVFLPVFEL